MVGEGEAGCSRALRDGRGVQTDPHPVHEGSCYIRQPSLSDPTYVYYTHDMSKRLQVLMEEAEWNDIQAAADRARLTVSEWVRQVLREARGAPHAAPTPDRVREGAPSYASEPGARSSSRSPVLVDDHLLNRVMDRYRFPTRDAAVHFALRRAADPPMTREELLAMQGTGWEGDLDAMRRNRFPSGLP